ncbi:hypothetical protein [Aneurinibacillus migulanus]|uniref:Uncharacterized protein n=1 Tax=Aneurinibacillus migulanus TaxID=47500 RepID=A0A0D1XKW1_ANEMI|nr:hypothetical protein [Aneurinibacillus migulanus]KIV52908.1 hypothetical protein TS65_22690 [Aneurinibacillus migulanus]KON95186.1 hypothetical protein AF333_06530 [Aneurinibacillus migulanus]MED0890923.1 hypothetical protein [Aneurinibacillus migulanus]MED1616615.1 hypothetical protein [Aneurinibacillus migulanus]SDI82700.1 hypothetical protein SAMN04487909_10878 [Aneurinibacillus migulanus]
MLEQFLAWVVANPYFALATAVAGIISLILTVKARPQKKPRYLITGKNIIRDYQKGIEELEITCKGEPVSNLTVTKIMIWNKGNQTIDKSDITEKAPLRINISDGFEILVHTKIFEKDPVNNFTIREAPDKSHLLIDFDYLDKNDGATIQLFHTAPSSVHIKVEGKVKGGGEIKNGSFLSAWARKAVSKDTLFSRFINFWIKHERKIDRTLYGIMGVFLILLDTFMIIINIISAFLNPSKLISFNELLAMFLFGIIGFLLIKSSKTNGFDSFYDDF